METNCQRAIKNALQVLAVVKEAKSPESEKELGERLIVGERATTEATGTSKAQSEDRGKKESGSGRGGVSVPSQETSSSNGSASDTQRNGGRVSPGGDSQPIHAGIHNSSVRENNTDESIGGDPCYVMLGEASGGCALPDRARKDELQRGSQLGEIDDGRSTGLVDETDSVSTIQGSSDHDYSSGTIEKKVKKPPMSAVSDDMEEQDVREALGAPPAVRPRRLTNLDHALASTPSSSTSREGIKRGHRREYNFVWTDEGFNVESWCNPICARIRSLPRREKCTCGECPKFCAECALDLPSN
ncbi:V protein [meleucus virus]|uniref:Non-structural protein V n=1 Tax=meleucus virus TaxID=2940994 RepID=A0AAE9HTU9_9MONO|nr:V protein [meleucus virus]